MLSRRELISKSPLLTLTPFAPGFLVRSLQAAPGEKDHRILVVLQLDGGNDGLNTVVPIRDENYARLRPSLRLDRSQLASINDDLAFHPSMAAAADLLEDDRLAIIQNVGYPNPSRSHFRSMAIWQTARFDEEEHVNYGWVGRGLDHGRRSVGSDSILVGHEEIPLALRGRRSVASSMRPNETLELISPFSPATIAATDKSSDELTSFVQRTVLDAYATADELVKAKVTPGHSYPATQLGERMKLIAQLIKSGLSTRCYYAIQSGYDTHSTQLPAHSRLLLEFSTAVKTFLDDLRDAGVEDRVALMAFSEFGRRIAENGSKGTDHGTAGPVFGAGSAVKAGVHGKTTGTGKRTDGDLNVGIDFRSVYNGLLQDWLQVEPLASTESLKPLSLFGK